jgi:transposase
MTTATLENLNREPAVLTESEPAACPTLLVAIEMGQRSWKLGFGRSDGTRRRVKSLAARDAAGLAEQIERSKAKLGLPASAPVLSVYEAGRDGFWLHRYLKALEVRSLVVDPASIEVNRRARRAKSDRLDLQKLMAMLRRHHGGERGLWSVVQAPSEAAEDDRQPQRHLRTLKQTATQTSNRIRGLLIAQGLDLPVDDDLLERLEQTPLWHGKKIMPELRLRIADELEQWQLVQKQIRRVEDRRRQRLAESGPADRSASLARQMMRLCGIGEHSAWLFATEIFSWRQIRNRRQLGALCGLTPTPYDSGQSRREQGISRAGNAWMRPMLVQIAWGWLRHQPQSKLARWFRERFDHGRRQRKIGIVALARKLLISLWRFLQSGEPPIGARLKEPASP